MNHPRWQRPIMWVAGILAVGFCVWRADEAQGRVGGGGSYSGGGGGGGGSGGGGGDGEFVVMVVRLLLWLCIEHPAVGVPLTGVVAVAGIFYWRRKSSAQRVSSAVDESVAAHEPPGLGSGRRALLQRDPNFSLPLFLDFVRLLYSRLHEAAGKRDWAVLAPYVSAAAKEALTRGERVKEVTDVVVGVARITGIRMAQNRSRISVQFEANYTEHQGAEKQRLYASERWTLGRAPHVLSKGPEEIASLRCPSCGSPEPMAADGRCPRCGEVTANGRFHWQLERVIVLEKKRPERPPIAPGGGGKEVGLERPTVFQANFANARKELQIKHPEFSWADLQRRIREVFEALNDAWSSRRWERARPYETDHLFDTHRYWMERYATNQMTNRIDKAEILGITPCKIESDAFLEAITVRLHAQMLDYTVDDKTGKVIGGSDRELREFSEYWTFIRRAGFDATKKGEAESCPSCAAPLKVNMAGICEYCNSHITTGEFDWVLSAIEQDEEYRG